LLAACLESRAGDARGRIVEIGVGADDVGGVRAELANEFLCARGAGEFIPGGGAAGDGNHRDQRMRGEELGGLAPAGHDIEEPIGDPRRFHRFCAISSATSVPGGDGLTTMALPTATAGATF
jgi:hypothetical protein